MPELDAQRLWEFVNSRIEDFHDKRIERLARLELNDVLKRKNPYLFKAKHLQTAPALVESILDAHNSSSEEKMFGDFLEELAVFISGEMYGGRKSSAKAAKRAHWRAISRMPAGYSGKDVMGSTCRQFWAYPMGRRALAIWASTCGILASHSGISCPPILACTST